MEKVVKERYAVLRTLLDTNEKAVCLAEDRMLKQNVTLTVYRDMDDSAITKLQERLRAQSSCSDIPSVIKILDIFREEQQLYVVSEYAQGISMRKYLEGKPELLSFEQAWRMLRPVAEAVAAVRKKGQMFQSLDMDSILVREDESVRLETSLIPQREKEEKEQSDDIYTLCTMLFEMTAANGLSLQQQEVLNRGMEAERHRQYSSMQELIRALDQGKGIAGKSRKQLFAGIAAGLLLILTLAAVFVGNAVLSSQSREPEVLELAGNYDRGSPRYREFVSFVKEHAVSEEESEDGIVYTLDEESVRQWNRPCNQFRFKVPANTVLEELKNRGYELTKVEETEENTVEIQTYGAVLTKFRRTTQYWILDGVMLGIVVDSVNQDLLSLWLARGSESEVPLSAAGADILCILSEDWVKNAKETAVILAEAEKEAFEINGDYIPGQYIYDSRDCRVGVYWGDADRVTQYTFKPWDIFEYYYWP